MQNIFYNPEYDEKMEKDGFFVIDLLDRHDIETLQGIFDRQQIHLPQHFFSTSFLPDPRQRKNISREIQEIIRPKIKPLLQGYQELGAVFLVKPSGENTAMPIHQDWTVVEEPKHHSITFWIPLQDTNTQNGAIQVLPGSHKLSTGLRSPSLLDPLKDIKERAAPMMQTLEMKAGQGFVFSHALLHSSFPNHSGRDRIAVAYGVLDQDAELVYYHKPNSSLSKVQKLSIPKDFFISYPKPGELPENSKIIEEFDYEERAVNLEDFDKFYDLYEPSFFHKILDWFHKKSKSANL
ncbi:MAG: phytanoyl-CoA dioxygenase family protein [Chitinophagales bacterium]|nr:phytanoyl-CoA dioxygenase family protein [Chitinophagales bacterium]